MTAGRQSWPGLSWYLNEAGPPAVHAGALSGSRRCRIAIIGAGLAGISTAVSLLERGIDDVCVLEADEPGAGASGRNGGFVFAGYSLANDALLKQVGRAEAERLHGWTRDAVHRVRERIQRYRIGCQINENGVLLADWFGDDDALEGFAARMRSQLGFELEVVPRERMLDWVASRRYGCGLHEPDSFHFHPLRHIRGLAGHLHENGVAVHGRSPVRSVTSTGSGWRLVLDGGRIEADELVLCTGGYDRQLWPPLNRALQPIATYIATTEPLGERIHECLPRPVAVYDTRFAFDYYRPLPDTRLLWGGRISTARRSPASIRRLMRRDLLRVFPNLADVGFEHAWGGWMSYARHEMPLLGRTDQGLWYGLAFGGHGMATTTLAGDILAEALSGEPERLRAFERWVPSWAGGWVGRAAVQARYWQLQAGDVWRARHSRGSMRC
jgi:glycine/D-amino acid oxidase-like deaminating enzyme